MDLILDLTINNKNIILESKPTSHHRVTDDENFILESTDTKVDDELFDIVLKLLKDSDETHVIQAHSNKYFRKFLNEFTKFHITIMDEDSSEGEDVTDIEEALEELNLKIESLTGGAENGVSFKEFILTK